MTILTRVKLWFGRLMFGVSHEYVQRFVLPQVVRLTNAGFKPDEIEQLWQHALFISNPSIIGGAPGSCLAYIADMVEAGLTVDEILNA